MPACLPPALFLINLSPPHHHSQASAECRNDGSSARLVITGTGTAEAVQLAEAVRSTGAVQSTGAVRSLAALEQRDGPFDAIVVAAGAASGVVEEVAAARIPLRLSQVAACYSCLRV